MRLAISTTETLTDLKTDLVVANNNNNRPMERMGQLQFSDLFTELPVPPLAAEVVETFNVLLLLYIILSTTVSFLDLKDAILFLYGLHFCVYISIFCMCVMCLTSFDGFF